MQVLRIVLLFAVLALLTGTGPVMGQESPADSGDDSSRRTDESEEAYRRRMELEGARESETYSDTSYSSQVEQEKIDKLPPESQENIRDQITDIIIESDGWEPSDVLEDYPYEPTEAAKDDPALREQEEEAWAEQVDKYHEREAAAFGAMRPPMPGDPGQPGSPGSPGSDEQAGGQPGGQSGQQGEQENDRTAGGFNPGQSGQSSSEDEISTAGVSESALDFLRGKRGPAAPAGGGNQPQGTSGGPAGGQESAGQSIPSLAGGGEKQSEPEQPPNSESADPSERAPDGSIPIEQLDQLQGLAGQSEPGSSSPSQPPSPDEPAPEQLAQTSDVSTNEQPSQDESQEQLAQSEAESTDQSSEQQQQPTNPELDLNTAGIIAIRDLEKLEGVEETDTDPDDQP